MIGDEIKSNKRMLGDITEVKSIEDASIDTIKQHESDVISSDEETSDQYEMYEEHLLNIDGISDHKFEIIFMSILDGLTTEYPPHKRSTRSIIEFDNDPSFNYNQYIHQLCLKFTSDDIWIPLTGLYYLYKILNKRKELKLYEKNKFRLVWISTIMAYKYLDDKALGLNIKHWCYMIGHENILSSRLSLHQLKEMEIEFLHLMDYGLGVELKDIIIMVKQFVPYDHIKN